MQLILEIVALIVAFIIFRKVLLHLFPAGEMPIELSQDSIQALRKYNKRYVLLFVGLGAVLTALLYYLIQWGYAAYHGDAQAEIVWEVEGMATLWPALTGGLLAASFIARWANEKLQKDGLFFFLEGIDDNLKGYNHQKLARWHVAVGILVVVLLVFSQGQVFLKVKSGQMHYADMAGHEHQFAVSAINKFQVEDSNIWFLAPNGDTLSTANFNGDYRHLLKLLQKENP